jgi:hypothetical protein
MFPDQFVQYVSSASFLNIVANFWSVPAGAIILYYYGKHHFNTPTYSLELKFDGGAVSAASRVRLLTQTPPIFTTRRYAYNRYSTRYIIILELAFFSFIFLSSTVQAAAKAGHITIPDMLNQSVEERVIFALFFLTGLLSSFPIISQVDNWILTYLHKAAFIPDDSQYLARKLYESPFVPAKHVFSTVRDSLQTRDTGRVAEGKATGVLERRVIDLLCLRAQVQTSMQSEKFKMFKIQLQQDFTELNNQTQALRAEITDYLRRQAPLLPDNVDNIDAYISAHQDEPGISDLGKERRVLQMRCDVLYETMCFLIALSICATTFTPEEVDRAITGLGFSTHIDPLPVFDLETVFGVSCLSFVLILGFMSLYVVVGRISGVASTYPHYFPHKNIILMFSLLITLAYSIVMIAALKLKRRWRVEQLHRQRPEAIVIAVSAYLLTVWINMIISYMINGTILIQTPYLFAVNQAVFGYFIAKYIDRSVAGQLPSIPLALAQGAAQGTVAGIAAAFTTNSVFVPGFTAFQWGVSGLAAGVVFQRIYLKAAKIEGDAPLESQRHVAESTTYNAAHLCNAVLSRGGLTR